MTTYYCYTCGRAHGIVAPIDPSASQPTQYQLNKFAKHTQPTSWQGRISVYDTPDWATYNNYNVAVAASGAVEIDQFGRVNLIYFAGTQTGLTYDNGAFHTTCSGVKAVLTEDAALFHAYPSDFAPESQPCASCGVPLPFDPRKP